MSGFDPDTRILITGASSGIGRSVALLLNRMGATVIACGRDAGRLEETRRQAATPGSFIPQIIDLAADLPALPPWLRGIAKEHGKLHGLVNCAGITWNAPLALYDMKMATAIFNICCHAPLILGGTFCDKRVAVGRGAAIVNIAAAAAVAPNPGQGIYAAAKGGLVSGSLCLSKEAAQRGIRVNCISPGLVRGPMMDATVRQLGESFLDRELPLYPLGLIETADVAELAAFLLLPGAARLTGQNIILSGGR